MRIVDQNGKLFGKINLLDFVILLILLLLIGGGIYKLAFVDNSIYIPDYQEGYVTIKLLSLREYKVDAVAEGDVIAVPKIQELGEVVEITKTNRVDSVCSDDGGVYPVENPLYYELTLKLKTDQLVERDGCYYVGKNYKLISGQALDVTNGVLPCKATVMSVEIIK